MSVTKQVQALINRNGVYCHYCGVHMQENPKDGYNPKGVSIDHVTPLIKGGAGTSDNLVLCCRRCNQRKKDRDYGEFYLTAHVDGILLFLMEGDES